MDEIQYRKGHHYLTLLYQIDTHHRRLLWRGEKRTIKTLDDGFTELEQEHQRKQEAAGEQEPRSFLGPIAVICSDIWKAYLTVIDQRRPAAVHVLDRFHLMQPFSKALDKVRAEEARRLKEQGQDPVLSKSRWCFLKRKENLSDPQALKLSALVLCRRDSFTKSLDFREDGIGRSRPYERVRVGVPLGGIAFDALDALDALSYLAERVPPNRLARDDVEPNLHLVEPRSIGGGVVKVKSGAPRQPLFDLGMLVGGVMVNHEMHVETAGARCPRCGVGTGGTPGDDDGACTESSLHRWPRPGRQTEWWCHGACSRA